MGKSVLDAQVNNSIFRKDFPSIIAMRRDLASIQPVRLVLNAGGYVQGQVLGRIVSGGNAGMYDKFSNVSGTSTATMILFENITSDDQPTTGGALARGLSAGYVFTDKLIDYSATAKTQLLAKDITDASGINVTKF